MENNRIKNESFGLEKVSEVNKFFLACEFKPHSSLWSVIEPFAYDITPAFLYSVLGILNYDPPSYVIVETESNEPLIGYLVTISNPETKLLLDKIKGYNGSDGFNTNIRKLSHVYVDINTVTTAWVYYVSSKVLETYEQIEQVEFGLWQEDKDQIELLDKITKPN